MQTEKADEGGVGIMQGDTLFLQALSQAFEQDTDRLMLTLEGREEHSFSAEHCQKMNKLIKHQRKPYFKLVCSASRRAACVAAAFVILIMSAMTVTGFFSEMFSGRDEIVEKYYISELPKDFEKTDDISTDDTNAVSYRRGNEYIVFAQYTEKKGKLVFDLHDLTESFTDTDGQSYVVYNDDQTTLLLWRKAGYTFTLHGNLNKDELVKLCRSIKVKD